jgi:hypothetical protein
VVLLVACGFELFTCSDSVWVIFWGCFHFFGCLAFCFQPPPPPLWWWTVAFVVVMFFLFCGFFFVFFLLCFCCFMFWSRFGWFF